MAKIAKKTKRYPSDLTDEEWEAIAPLMPQPGRRGRPREVEFREVINAVRYLVRSGCGWRMLPAHFGHWRTVYGWFRELARRFLFQTIHDVALMVDRERQLMMALAALATAPRQGELPRIVFRNIAVIAFLVGLALIGLGILGLGDAQKSGWILIVITIVAQLAVWIATAWVGAPDRAPGKTWSWLWRWLVGAAIAVIVAFLVVATAIGIAEIVDRITD